MTTTTIKTTLSAIMKRYNGLRKHSAMAARRALSSMMKVYWAIREGQISTDAGRFVRGLDIMTEALIGKRTNIDKYRTTATSCQCPSHKFHSGECKHRLALRLVGMAF